LLQGNEKAPKGGAPVVDKKECKRCNFDNEFIRDYDEEGKEYVFCGNCGTIKEWVKNK
jgi:hypothetical protein